LQDRLFVGVDIGGTKIAAGLVDQHGEIKTQIRTPMIASGGPEAGLAAVVAAIDQLFFHQPQSRGAIAGIGICAPGPLDPKTGIILNPPNLPCWRDFPLAQRIEQTYKVRVKVENDASAAALAEVYWGAGRGYRHVFYASVGTGIGTGIVIDDHIFNGRTGAAPEGGHMSIDFHGPPCTCGKPGCIEILAAGPAIARRARAKLASAKAPISLMFALSGGSPDQVTSEIVGKAYAAGDSLAKDVLIETVDLLALWLSNIVDLIEPDAIVVGGGAAGMLSPFFAELHKRMDGYCIIKRSSEVPLVRAHYGADSGIAGGAALCWQD
jgi:glucokinase